MQNEPTDLRREGARRAELANTKRTHRGCTHERIRPRKTNPPCPFSWPSLGPTVGWKHGSAQLRCARCRSQRAAASGILASPTSAWRVSTVARAKPGVQTMAESTGIESTLQENRLFPPSPQFSQQAHIKSRDEYNRLYRESIDRPEKFWGGIAEQLHWFKKWDKVLDWQPPYAKWFVGGQTNVA